ncbi:transcription factor Dp-2 [Salvelinus namaycush]|uniref:Transcription factor Dp-2 n=1 Tax=Salvelinus namaycush TaxID=8040 RepID=A0A8U0P425_SALNM|nr:transcription factor Dp-2 [Salvelinus namaycush]
MGLSLGLEIVCGALPNLILAKSLIPRSLEIYIIGMARGTSQTSSFPDDLDSASLDGRRSYSHSSTALSESRGQAPSSFNEEEEDDDDNEPSSQSD